METRIGLVLPSPNIHMEPQFNALGLEGVTFHATRVMLKETTEAALIAMEKDLEYAAELLSTIAPAAVGYCCTSGSFIQGSAFDEAIAAAIRRICSCPAVTTSGSMEGAFRAMGVKSIALVTPYTSDINRAEVRYIESKGFAVASEYGFGIVDNPTLVALTREQWIDAAIAADTPEADALFLSCTNTKAMPVADYLEQKLGKPVLTSNATTLWALLRAVGYEKAVSGCGALLREHLV